MPKENFQFTRMDSCLTKCSEVRQSKLRKMEILSRDGKLPERVPSEKQSLFSYRYTFSLSIAACPFIEKKVSKQFD